ncbi:T9SS type A sorting domain-containing protein [Dyadobacter alkalitolerans]|uniref:T9SS type A sorting domain-containing protein n=1 Tax=Dyadobacter alkalitolerans TaxID=492736 RepID=UPI00041F9DB0|nr:T9SS type A sorting domain-containing protein [Dyadobacter alkalitolerans]
MSKFYNLLLVTLFLLNCGSAMAACPTNGAYFMHQSDVDNYAANGGCSVITGDLWIVDAGEGPGNQIYNLNGLAMITEVQGYVYIIGSSLTTLAGLGNLTRIAAVMTIQNNSKLTSLYGLNGLKELGYLALYDNPLLNDLVALTGLSTTEGIHIRNNASLAALTGLEGITAVNVVGVSIEDNNLLESLDGLRNLVTTPILWIDNNRALSSMNTLSKINPATLQQVYIHDNPELLTCSIDPICTYIRNRPTAGGSLDIDNNGAGCESNEQLEEICSDPLPVTLAQFVAKKEAQRVMLSWTTTYESNSRAFIIQHSVNGRSWNNIGTIKATAESNMSVDYNFAHDLPSHINYYRLKMEDHDNTFAYSSIKQLNFSDLQNLADVYPNPASEYVSISTALIGRIKQVIIYDNQGSKVLDSASQISPLISIKHLRPGIYSIKIIDKDNSEKTQKLAVAR